METREVSKQEFFNVIGPLDVVTRAIYRTRADGGIFTIFELRNRIEIGRSYRDPEPRYVLTNFKI